MLSGFESLQTSEMNALLDGPVGVVALLGAVDGKFDQQEGEWSERLVDVFTYGKAKNIHAYYEQVSERFIEKVGQKLAGLSGDADAKAGAIAKELEALNPILAKLDPALGAALYKSFLKLAEETAKASGGFLRIGAISNAEHRWVGLPMLMPIQAPAGSEMEADDESV